MDEKDVSQTPATPSPKGFLKKLAAMMATRLGMTLLSGAIIGFITNSPAIFRGFRAVCACIGMLGDEKVAKKVGSIFGDGDKETPEGEDPKPTLKGRIVQKTQATLEPVREKIDSSVEQGKQAANKVEKKAEDKANDVVNAIKQQPQLPIAQYGPPPAPNGAAPPPYSGMPPIPQQMPQPANLGGVVGNNIDRAGNAYTQQALAKQAAIDKEKIRIDKRREELAPIRETYSIWWAEHGPNGYCPYRNCRFVMNVSRSGKGFHYCPKCGRSSRDDQIRAMGTPPMPLEPPPAFSAWKEKREEAEARKSAQAAGKKASEPEKGQ